MVRYCNNEISGLPDRVYSGFLCKIFKKFVKMLFAQREGGGHPLPPPLYTEYSCVEKAKRKEPFCIESGAYILGITVERSRHFMLLLLKY